MQRVINFDWLEVFCYEQVPLEPALFEQEGYVVKVREYGTPIYRQMFSVCAWDTDSPMFEIRRDPYSVRSSGGIMNDGACHLRVTNPFCYVPGIVDKFIAFMQAHQLQFVSISRVDVCCDFECFEDGASVEQFLSDYICERFYKENQPRVHAIRDNIVTEVRTNKAHGTDTPRRRVWNSLSWGSNKSLIKTRIYNKTYEMKCAKHKEYICSVWRAAGWDGKSDVWRLEFQINASTDWASSIQGENFRVELREVGDKRLLGIWFHGLASRYFRFRKVEVLSNGNRQRKDRCPLYLPLRYHAQDLEVKPAKPNLKKTATRQENKVYRYLQGHQWDMPAEVARSAHLVALWLERKYISEENAVQ